MTSETAVRTFPYTIQDWMSKEAIRSRPTNERSQYKEPYRIDERVLLTAAFGGLATPPRLSRSAVSALTISYVSLELTR